jgi:SGNH domain (fused to AT3 domains)
MEVRVKRPRRLGIVIAPLVAASLLLGPLGAGAAEHPRGLPSLSRIETMVKTGERLKTYPSNLVPQLRSLGVQFYSGKCVENAGSPPTVLPTCAFGDLASTKVVVLYGDSYAGMWFPTFQALANRDHFKLYLIARLTCPFTLVATLSASCRTFQTNALSYISSLHPTSIVFSEENVSPFIPADVQITPTAYAAGIPKAIAQFSATNKLVLLGMPSVLLGSPLTAVQPAQCLSAYLSNITKCMPTAKNAIIAQRLSDDTAAVKLSGARVISVTKLFCAKSCPMVVDKTLVFSDPFHVNQRYAAVLVSAMGSLVNAYLP